MNLQKKMILSWLILVLLTLISVAVGNLYNEIDSVNFTFVAIVMLLVAIKGQQVIDVFMEMQHAPNKWRYLLMSYVVIIPLVITLIYS